MKTSEHTVLESQVVELIPALRRFSRRFYPSKTDADDLVQETLVKALGNLDKFTPGSSLKSWMFTIMRNTFCTKFQMARREAPGAKDCVALDRSVGPSQEAAVRMGELEEAINSLPRYQRELVIEIALHGESYESVAKRTGCALGTLKSRLNRARQHLSEGLGLPDEDAAKDNQ